MTRSLIGTVALLLALTGCAARPVPTRPRQPLDSAALDAALLTPGDVNAVMGASLTAHPPSSEMNDHRDLLRNRNCLAIWQPVEAVIYDGNAWTGVRRQVLRSPDTDNWTDRIVQSVVAFPSAQAARAFFSESADRWSKCTNHRLNITVNDVRQPTWQSGDLNETDTRITIPVTRGSGDQVRLCERALAVDATVIIDADACGPGAGAKVGAIVEKIEANLTR